ncbi:hypothetical protein GGQ88_001070 [Novosphingobium hassiacum]|uniref:Uncharacterized protein n=1 Tax=Novosphingobium hassiacum TaxID=173676 RepID=A0A7W5ZV59_9SPHN|nr:hypothetical protein [Novosphingobium hassiacum]
MIERLAKAARVLRQAQHERGISTLPTPDQPELVEGRAPRSLH